MNFGIGDRIDFAFNPGSAGIVVAICDHQEDDVIVWRRDDNGEFESWFAADLAVVQRMAEPIDTSDEDVLDLVLIF